MSGVNVELLCYETWQEIQTKQIRREKYEKESYRSQINLNLKCRRNVGARSDVSHVTKKQVKP